MRELHSGIRTLSVITMFDFNCFICTDTLPLCYLVKFIHCGHEVCISCCQTLVRLEMRARRYPKCPFCREGILFVPVHEIDNKAILALYEQGILVTPQDRGITFLHTCYDDNCAEFLRINGHCHCSMRMRYVCFSNKERKTKITVIM